MITFLFVFQCFLVVFLSMSWGLGHWQTRKGSNLGSGAEAKGNLGSGAEQKGNLGSGAEQKGNLGSRAEQKGKGQ